MNPWFIALQIIGLVGSWSVFVVGVHSALCLAPLALTMTLAAIILLFAD